MTTSELLSKWLLATRQSCKASLNANNGTKAPLRDGHLLAIRYVDQNVLEVSLLRTCRNKPNCRRRGRQPVTPENFDTASDRKLTEFRRSWIRLVFQLFNLIPALTAAENIMLPLYAAGSKQTEAEVLPGLAKRLGIADRLSHRPDALSGGPQQRVAIARALATDPAIVFADEPSDAIWWSFERTVSSCDRSPRRASTGRPLPRGVGHKGSKARLLRSNRSGSC